MGIITIERVKKWSDKQNILKLIDALNSNDTEIRKAVCLSLATSKSVDALLALRYIVENDNDEFVVLSAKKSIDYMIDNAYEVISIDKSESIIMTEERAILQTV